jgi:hypothetical protein
MPCQPLALARLVNLSLVSLIVGGMLSWGPAAHATGRWNLPSTVPQYFGYGHGPGYHAPRIRMPGHSPSRVLCLVKTPIPDSSRNCDSRETLGQSVPASRMDTPPTHGSMPNSTISSPERQAPAPMDYAMAVMPQTDVNHPQSEASDSPGVMNQAPVTFPEPLASPSQFPSTRDSWLASVPLFDVTELASKPVSPVLIPPGKPFPEEPEAAWLEQSEEIGPAPSGTILKDPLFSAPPLPAHQG